jgi:hypothetical protein
MSSVSPRDVFKLHAAKSGRCTATLVTGECDGCDPACAPWPPLPGLARAQGVASAEEEVHEWYIKLFPSDRWLVDTERWKMRQVLRENPLRPEVLAAFLRKESIPAPIRDHIADTLLGRVQRRRGRPVGPSVPFSDSVEFEALLYRVARYKRVYERKKSRTRATFQPYEEALGKVSAETGIPEATLDKWCRPR